MRVKILDNDALKAISPEAMASYLQSAGWKAVGLYGEYSTIYSGNELPELVIPNIKELDDYGMVMSYTLTAIANSTGVDELTIYNTLVGGNGIDADLKNVSSQSLLDELQRRIGDHSINVEPILRIDGDHLVSSIALHAKSHSIHLLERHMTDIRKFTEKSAMTTIRTYTKNELHMELYNDFHNQPLEDGMNHEAEKTIGRALQGGNADDVLSWLHEFCTDSQSSFAADALQCVARQGLIGTPEWRESLIRNALASENIQMRDSAVIAVEHWEEKNLVQVLDSHQDESTWLHDYIQQVVKYLSK